MSTTADAPADAEQWISRADAAKLARCSEDTIKRDVRDHELETRPGPNGRVMLRVADLLGINRISPEDIPSGASAAGTAEVRRLQEQLANAQRELGEVRGRLATRDELVTVLHEQLRETRRGRTTASSAVHRRPDCLSFTTRVTALGTRSRWRSSVVVGR
jgi:hypothetical protein